MARVNLPLRLQKTGCSKVPSPPLPSSWCLACGGDRERSADLRGQIMGAGAEVRVTAVVLKGELIAVIPQEDRLSRGQLPWREELGDDSNGAGCKDRVRPNNLGISAGNAVPLLSEIVVADEPHAFQASLPGHGKRKLAGDDEPWGDLVDVHSQIEVGREASASCPFELEAFAVAVECTDNDIGLAKLRGNLLPA